MGITSMPRRNFYFSLRSGWVNPPSSNLSRAQFFRGAGVPPAVLRDVAIEKPETRRHSAQFLLQRVCPLSSSIHLQIIFLKRTFLFVPQFWNFSLTSGAHTR